LAKDVEDFKTFTVEEQKYIKNMLSFFAFADGLVSENLVQRFTSDIGIQEAKCFFAEQNSMECVHAETYQALLETLVGSEKERDELHRGFETIPSLKAKMKWIECWMNPKINFVFRLLAFSVLEGISFSGAFCSIYWIKHIKPGMMPGLIQSNNFIARDEALHTEHAIALFKLWKQKPPQEMVQGIIHSAILVEDQFIDESLPLAFIGMNGEDMKLYLRFVADRHLFELGYKPLYGVKENPFSWMVNLNIEERNQFFESHPSYEQHKHTLVAAVSSATASTTNSNAAVSSASSSWDPSQFNLDSL
jgi:ribonucleoside-diphosphate reductase subunit M2